MGTQETAAALHRLQTLLQRHPDVGMHDDAPATARWEGGTRVATRHADGTRIDTDIPAELGGTNTAVSPGWLSRAALAACATTRIVMQAAQDGIELAGLEVHASSRSDARGVLGLAGADGRTVSAGPLGYELAVRISAPRESAERLHALVEAACRCSPVASAIREPAPVTLRVEVWSS